MPGRGKPALIGLADKLEVGGPKNVTGAESRSPLKAARNILVDTDRRWAQYHH